MNVGPEDATLTGVSVWWVSWDGVKFSAEDGRQHLLTSITKCVLLDDTDPARLAQSGGDLSIQTENGPRHGTLTVLIGEEHKQLTFVYENQTHDVPQLVVEILE